MKNMLAVIGLVLALAGLGVAIFQDDIRDEQPTSVESVTQDAMDKGREIWDGDKRLRKDNVTYAAIIAGALGALMGLLALFKDESKGMALAAMAIGGVAAGWHWIFNLLN